MHLVLDLDHVEEILRRRLVEVENVEWVQLLAAGDGLDLRASLRWKGMGSQVSIRVGEIRLRDRFLGLRLSRLRILGGVPVPMGVVEAVAARLEDQPLTVFRGTGIIVVDLGRWLPAGLSLEVVTVQSIGRELHVWLGRGVLQSLPEAPKRALPPGAP
jgi:hypothetical protein